MLYSDPNFFTEYKGYKIAQKRDFGNGGFLINGHKVSHGYNVLPIKFGDVEDMPGAAWFLTVADAKSAIDDLIASGGRRIDREHEFWTRNRLRNATETRALELFRAVKDHLDRTYDATGGAQGPLRALLAEIEDSVDNRDTIHDVATDVKTRVGVLPERVTEILNEKS